MQIRYTKPDGTQVEFSLGDQPVTIGRSADADIVLLDERVSRIHCGLRLWDGDFYIKDLKSRNGTWVNNSKVDVAKLKAGDVIRTGSTTFTFEQTPAVGAETAIQEIEGKMDLGKGYTTILREIVDDVAPQAKPAPSASEQTVPGVSAPTGASKLGTGRRIIKIKRATE
ncbi:MAG: FHA domain-containing protein [Kiritimatiellae bacterium]|nr:FHA domain-containing protein [Kiritimatiellia bacterium]